MTLATKVALRDLLVGDGLHPHDAGRILRFAEKLAGDRSTHRTRRKAAREGLVFLRAPMQETEEGVCEWLTAKGCDRIETHQGPDGQWRGSGVVRSAGAVALPSLADQVAALELAERAGL